MPRFACEADLGEQIFATAPQQGDEQPRLRGDPVHARARPLRKCDLSENEPAQLGEELAVGELGHRLPPQPQSLLCLKEPEGVPLVPRPRVIATLSRYNNSDLHRERSSTVTDVSTDSQDRVLEDREVNSATKTVRWGNDKVETVPRTVRRHPRACPTSTAAWQNGCRQTQVLGNEKLVELSAGSGLLLGVKKP